MFSTRIIGYIGLSIIIVSYACIFIAILNAPWFSWTSNALSDLGVHEGSALIFNGGLIASGILLTIFAFLIFRFWINIVEKIGGVLIFLSGIALIGIGVFTEEIGDVHMFFAIMFFVLISFSLMVLGFGFILNKRDKKLGYGGIICGLFNIFIWAFPWGSIGIVGVAIPEFLSSLSGVLWIAMFSHKVIRLNNTFRKRSD